MRLRDYEPADRAAFLELMRAAWGETSMSGEEFDWWFERNPTGERLIAVAEEDGEVLGVAGTTCLPMVVGGAERLGSFSVHATTSERARGRGIFGELELHNEARTSALGVSCVLAFASAPTIPIFLNRLGYREVGRLRIWARILRPDAPVRHLLRRPSGEPALRAASDEARAYGAVRVVPLTRFGRVTDAAYRAARDGLGNHVVRETAHLNWRYLDSPWGYRGFASIREGQVNGYAVVRTKRHRGAPLAVLGDLLAPGFAETRALLRRCIAEVVRADAIVALPPRDPGQRRAFLSLGFLPSPLALQLMGKPLQADVEFPTDPGAWHFSLGDTDFF